MQARNEAPRLSPVGLFETVVLVARRFDACLRSGNIGRVPIDPGLVSTELREAENDLEIAGTSFKGDNDKWAVKQSNRALLHVFRALILLKGYEARGVDCLKYAVDELYVREGVFAASILEDFDYGREIAKGNDCLCVYDRNEIEELLASTRVLLEKTQGMAEKG
ncbi:MAG TPA: hypothetical protein VLV30_04220 [Methanomicrobiales archaeon]|nr:hypothetical protein [Methanomicrobiales archaeon]